MRTLAFLSYLLAAGLLLGFGGPGVQAGTVGTSDFALSFEPGIGRMPTTHPEDPVSVYLDGGVLARVTEVDVQALGESVAAFGQAHLPVFVPNETQVQTYYAPAAEPRMPAAAPPEAPAQLASFAYPQATGLGDIGSGGRDVPLGDARYFGSGPGGYGTFLQGQPPGGLKNWSHVTRTGISYIRPNVNIQMMLALDVPGTTTAGTFEGPGFDPNALLAIERETKVHSDDIGARTAQFGRTARPEPPDEPQTALTVGLDLGVLPTFLSQMGMGVSIVASRGQQTGDLRVALVGTTELPVDWTPIERPYQHPIGQGRDYPILASVWDYPSGGAGGSGGPPEEGGGGNPPTPITPNPPIPEPATVLTLLGGIGVTLIRSRRKRR